MSSTNYERVILEDGSSRAYTPRAEEAVLENGSKATDLILRTTPRWKMWRARFIDISTVVAVLWGALTFTFKPKLVETINQTMEPYRVEKEALEDALQQHIVLVGSTYVTRAEWQQQMDRIEDKLSDISEKIGENKRR